MLVLFAAVMPIIVLFCGLVLDVGMLQLKTLQLQNAADAAAFGAVLEAERNTGNWMAQGKADAGINGFTDGSNSVTITVPYPPPASGPYAGRYDAFLITVSQTVSTLFMGALSGAGSVTLSAQSIGLMTPCIYLTGTGALQYYTLDGDTGSLLGSPCPIYVNTRLTTNVANIATESIDVAGSAASSSIAGFTFPPPSFNVPVMADPLAAVASPAFSSCNHTSYSKTGGSATLSYGTYCKGLNLSNTTIFLNPGLYIITGGATWTNSTVSGSGVTLFFTSGGGGSDGKFIIQSSSNVTISAPTASSNGSIPGILVFTDRTWTPTSPQDVALQNSTIQGDGIWYLPGTGLYVSSCGNVNGTNYLGVVADNMYLAGTIFTVSNNYSNVTTGNPFRTLSAAVQ
jgi:hypothetical protein